jgi:cholesterol transport system auxiliary component
MIMPATTTRLLRAALAGLALAAAAGCSGLEPLLKATEPVELYDLTPKSTYAGDLPSISAQVVVDEPTAASSVNTDRIAVKPNAYAVQYLPVARWVDRAPLLVQTLLLESFENSGRVRSVGRQAIGLSSDFTLVSELREFQAMSREGGPEGALDVLVQLNVKIVQEPQGLIAASQSFMHRVPARSAEALDVVAAFDDALGKAMGQAVDWSVREIAGMGG